MRQVPESVAFARRLRRNQTDAEEVLWQLLRTGFRAAKFRRQVPIGPFVADFLSYSARLVIEADGPIHEAAADARRDQWFAAHRWRVLRFTNHQVLTDSKSVAATITTVINAQSDRSSP